MIDIENSEPSDVAKQALDRLAAIRERLKKRSQGPWYFEERGEGYTLFAKRFFGLNGEEVPVHPFNLLNTAYSDWDSNGKANRDFIANAAEDMWFLLDWCEHLESLSKHLLQKIQDHEEEMAEEGRKLYEIFQSFLSDATKVKIYNE